MSDSTASPPARAAATVRPELRIWDTVSETYGSVFIENLRLLPRAALVPALLLIALSFLLQALGLYSDPNDFQDSGEAAFDQALASLPAVLASVVLALPTIVFAVAWIRLTLLGPETAPPPLQPQWSSAHWRVLGYGALASLVSLAVFVVGSVVVTMTAFVISLVGRAPLISLLVIAIAFAGVLAVVAFSTAAGLRLLLPIPALLVGQQQSVKTLWQKSRGYSFALVVAFLLVSLPLLAIGFAPLFLAGDGLAALSGEVPVPVFYDPAGPYFPLLVLWNTVQVLVWTAVFAAFIAIVYRSLIEGQNS
jgi:hypothetical protein